MNSYCVLMTSCIDPARSGVRVHRSDPVTRLEDTKAALQFWLQIEDTRILGVTFIDNSGYPLDALVAHAHTVATSKRLEFISIADNTLPSGMHYGFNELRMVDHALRTSELLRSTSHFIKATGRLRFPAVSKLLDRLPEGCLFSVDCRNSSFLRKLPQVFVATQLMVFSTAFYRATLLGIPGEMGNGISHAEDILYRKLIAYRGHALTMLRWPVNVSPAGNAAHWEKRYDSPRQILVDACRAFARTMFPNWWI